MRSENFKREELKNFITKIEYKNGEETNSNASGVIVKTELSAYIITVKHTFKKRERQPLNKVELIDYRLIKVYDYNKNIIPINKIIFLDNQELDIALLRIDINKFKQVNTLELYTGEFNFCAIVGYPETREDNQSVIIDTSNPDKLEKDEFSIELKAESPIISFRKDEMETLKGLSGSGVFKKGGSGKIYLIGIQYDYTDYTNLLKILDLRTIVDDIEDKIEEKLKIGKYPFFEKLGIDASKLNFESLENRFRLNKDIQKIKNSDDEYKFLLEDNRTNRNLEKSYIAVKKEMKRISDIYFYHGKIYFENNDKIRAFNAFSRAIELYPEYKLYFLKEEFKEINLTNKQKEDRAKLIEKIRVSINSDITEIILEDNIHSNDINNNSDSLEKNIEKIISFLSQNFNKNKEKIINWLLKLSKVKLKNGKPIEAENILLDIRDGFDDGERKNEINKRLLEIYKNLANDKNSSISLYELRFKLEKLLPLFDNRNEIYLNITNIITNLNIDNDCFIKELEKQRVKIEELKNKNYELRIKNENYYEQINYNPSFVIESAEKSNIKFLLVGLLILVFSIILTLAYFDCPALKLIKNLNSSMILNWFS